MNAFWRSSSTRNREWTHSAKIKHRIQFKILYEQWHLEQLGDLFLSLTTQYSGLSIILYKRVSYNNIMYMEHNITNGHCYWCNILATFTFFDQL